MNYLHISNNFCILVLQIEKIYITNNFNLLTTTFLNFENYENC